MHGWWRYALIAAVIVAGGYGAVDWLRSNRLRMLGLTTADPDTLGQVLTDSMAPFTVTLETDHIRHAAGPAPTAPTSQRISFRVPAAYVTELHLKNGPSGPQRVGFEVWSRSFDPAALDRIADSARCRVGVPCHAEPTDRTAQRKRNGEASIKITVGNSVSNETHRTYVLGNLDGAGLKKPCRITEDAQLGITVAETPDGLRPGDACNFIGNPGIRTRDGKSFPPKNFLKRKPDGTPEFLVRCHNFSSDPLERQEISCRLYAFLGIWGLSVLFHGIAPTEWSDLHARVLEFLARHTIERTS